MSGVSRKASKRMCDKTFALLSQSQFLMKKNIFGATCQRSKHTVGLQKKKKLSLPVQWQVPIPKENCPQCTPVDVHKRFPCTLPTA